MADRRPLVTRVVLVGSVLVHLAAALFFVLLYSPPKFYAETPSLLFFFLTASMVISVFMFKVSRKINYRILLVLRALVQLNIAYTFRSHFAVFYILMLVLYVEVCVYETLPTSVVVCGLLLAGSLLLVGVRLRSASTFSFSSFSELLVYFVAAVVVIAVSSSLTFTRERMVRSGNEAQRLGSLVTLLAKEQMGYLEFAKTAEARSILSERRRLSSEVHDTIGYTFTNLIMVLEAAQDLAKKDIDKLMDVLSSAKEQLQEGYAETREALYKLREREETKPSFLAAVRRLVNVFTKATGVAVSTEYANFPMSCSEEVETSLYHFIQESLTNAFRHGRATEIKVLFWIDEDKIQVSVIDNGSGVTDLKEGIGIRGMRERLGKLGGTLTMRNRPNGFRIMAEVPVKG